MIDKISIQLIRYFDLKSKKLFSLPCRHHILELILSSVYFELFGRPSDPAVSLLVNFQKRFDELNLNEIREYEFEIDNENRSLKFIDHQICLNQKRADFRELLELTRRIFQSKDQMQTINLDI